MKKYTLSALFLTLTLTLSACTIGGNNDATTEKNDSGDFTVGENGQKTIAEQRSEIKDAMTRAMNTEVVWEEITSLDPTSPRYANIMSITFDGLEYDGQKTKIFAFMGFPEGASADNPAPAVVLLHGLDGHPMMEWVRMWNKRGYAAISISTAGRFPSKINAGATEGQSEVFPYGMAGVFKEEGYIDVPPHSYPSEYSEVSLQSPYHGLTAAILASNLLRQDSRVDDSKVGIHGISWGGIMASQIIGYDNRFAFAIPVYGTAYLGDELRPYEPMANEYADALWAAERNIDNAKMPILWLTYSDDNNFGVNSYVRSYEHTADFNGKNTLTMLTDWGHSHTDVFRRDECIEFADWAVGKGVGFPKFATQPDGREISCKVVVPDGFTGKITPVVHFIDEPMSYSKHNKYGWGEYNFLDQVWQSDSECLTYDVETATVSGTIPATARGYYINLRFTIGESELQTSSVYVDV